ncbi:phage/plasmid primase, P4 family [Methylobacterium sp. P31]
MNYFENPKHASRLFRFTPLERETKNPFLKGWQKAGLAAVEMRDFGPFPDRHNIGILTGAVSGDIVDTDLDGPLTVLAGGMLLPGTEMIFGRRSKTASHYIYRVRGSTKTLQIKHPITGRMLVEVRGDGAQTMAPMSIHPDTGEMVRFEEGKDGEPTLIDREALDVAAKQIAAVSVIGEHWKEGGRHKLALWFAGLCAYHAIDLEVCQTLVRVICLAVHDEEMNDRLRAVEDTYDGFSRGSIIEWRNDLTNVLGAKAVGAIAEWLGGRTSLPKPLADRSSTRTISVTVDTSTDISTAEAFCEWMGDRLIYAEHEGRFYENHADVYDPVSSVAVKARIMDFLKEPANAGTISDPARVRASQSSTRINAVYELSKALMRRDDREFNRHSHLIGTRNGVLDLTKRELVETTDIVTRRIGAEFHPHAWCPKFKKFADQVFDGDNDKIEYARQAIGYTLTGSVEAQVMFILIGSGANGKSVFLNLLQALMGDYGTSLPAHSIMQPKFANDKTDDLASLDGKRFAFATEGEAGDKLAVAKIKRMTGGDMMSVKRLYKDYFNLKPEFKLWFASNELPQISGNDDAIWRRIHVIEFPVTFKPEERDPKLLATLKGELPGILNWALEGLRQIGELKGDFLAPPESVKHSTAEYRSGNDNISDFIEGACVRDPNGRIMMGELHERYVEYCENSGSDPMNKITFSKSLNRMGFGVHKTSKGNARRGLRFK